MIIQRQENRAGRISTNTGAYCLARKKLPLDLLTDLTTEIGTLIQQEAQNFWRWRNRRVFLIDGTSLTMPDTEESQLEFPQQGAQKPGLGFPICRVLTVNCLTSGALLNAAIGRLKGRDQMNKAYLEKSYTPLNMVM